VGLSYHFKLAAPAEKTADELKAFLEKLESTAKSLGFSPTMVLNAKFDTPERRDFARRLTTGERMQDDLLKGVVLLKEGQVWSHDQERGECRVIPEQGVMLVVTDEKGRETVFGFLRYPGMLKDVNDRGVVGTGLADRWIFRDFVDSPDPRFRELVKQFAEAGYVVSVRDEFSSGA